MHVDDEQQEKKSCGNFYMYDAIPYLTVLYHTIPYLGTIPYLLHLPT